MLLHGLQMAILSRCVEAGKANLLVSTCINTSVVLGQEFGKKQPRPPAPQPHSQVMVPKLFRACIGMERTVQQRESISHILEIKWIRLVAPNQVVVLPEATTTAVRFTV